MWLPEYVAVVSYSSVRFIINVKLGQYLIDTVNYRQGQSSYCGGWRAAMASGCLSSLQMNLRNQSNQSPINVTCQILTARRITKERDLALHLWEGSLRHFKRRHQREQDRADPPRQRGRDGSGAILTRYVSITTDALAAQDAPNVHMRRRHHQGRRFNAADTHL